MRDEAEPSADEAAKWLLKAAEDLAVARMVAANPAAVNWAACYHAQQAAEKALKAVLVLRGVDFPRTHALVRLLDLIPLAFQSRFARHDLEGLSIWAVAGRYPEDIESPTADETAAYIDIAAVTLSEAAALLDDPID